ncbi:ATP-binding protein [Actinomadura viridis]|uniref:ATP-binding protein n=1 Tax=Actinomadura viridis TaxID=58110 RepID=UPI00368DE271
MPGVIVEHRQRAGREASEAAMSLTISDRGPGRSPDEPTSFVGRRGELAVLERLVGGCGLVTLTGPGGMGKSRLAIRAAARLGASFEHGVRYVDLSGPRHSSLLAQAVGEAFGLPDQAPAAALDALVRHVARRRTLLVLDHCDELTDGCAMLVEILLREAPGLRVLATGRRPLGIPGERVLPVPPLAVPTPGPTTGPDDVPDGGTRGSPAGPCDAVRLFCERAADAAPGWTPTEEDAAAVARLCDRLEGVPLAIELAAAHLRTLPAGRLAARLDERIPRPYGFGPARERTLRAVLDWSHGLCPPGRRLLWARLSVLAGEFDLEDAERVCADAALPAGRIAGLLEELAAGAIVVRLDGAGGEGAARYRMPGAVREYGAERLELLGQTGVLRDRAFARFGAAIGRATAELGTAEQPRWLEWFGRERANVHAALEHGLRAAADEEVVRAILGYGRILALRGLIGEARYWGARAFADRCPMTPRIRESAEMPALFGLLAALQEDPEPARELMDRAEARARAACDDVRGLAYVRQAQGVAAFGAGRAEEAAGLLREARDLHRLAGNDDVLAPVGGVFLAAASALAGDPGAAVRYATEVVRETEAAGELWCRSYGLCVLGLVTILGGRPAPGMAEVRAGLRIKRDLGDRPGIGLALDVIGVARTALGEPEPAARLFGAADASLGFTGVTLLGAEHRRLRAPYRSRAERLAGAEAFRAAYRRGADLPFEAAVSEALGA